MAEAYISAHNKRREGDASLNFDQRATHIKKELSQKKKDVSKAALGDIVKDMPHIISSLKALRTSTREKAGLDISLAKYLNQRYGVELDRKGGLGRFMQLIGFDKRNATIADLKEGNSTIMHFQSQSDYKQSFEWLIGEVVTEELRTMIMEESTYQRMVSSMEVVPVDSIVVPIIKNANAQWKARGEYEDVQFGSIDFDEIRMECEDLSVGFSISDKLARNSRINILREFTLSAVAGNLDKQLTFAAINRLINGNIGDGSDAAPVVGVVSTGSFNYDDDILNIIIESMLNNRNVSTVLGNSGMLREMLSLPEFKGFDGTARVADITSNIPLPAQYNVLGTRQMPPKTAAGGQLLFIDPRYALTHYSSQALIVESDREIRQKKMDFVMSMTSVFVKKLQDASVVLDSTLDVATNPYPEFLKGENFNRIAF